MGERGRTCSDSAGRSAMPCKSIDMTVGLPGAAAADIGTTSVVNPAADPAGEGFFVRRKSASRRLSSFLQMV